MAACYEMTVSKQNWSIEDTNFLLETLGNLNIVDNLDGRKSRNNNIFKRVFDVMIEAGIHRSVDQIKNRWKCLKATYCKAKTQNGVNGFGPATFHFYDKMDELMGNRQLADAASKDVATFQEDPALKQEYQDGSITVSRFNSINGVDAGLPALPKDPALKQEDQDGSVTDEESCADESDSSLNNSRQCPPETVYCIPQTSREPRATRTRTKASSYDKALLSWSTEHQSFLKKVQESHQRVQEEQSREQRESDATLLRNLVEQNLHSSERLMGQLLYGLKDIFPRSPSDCQAARDSNRHNAQAGLHMASSSVLESQMEVNVAGVIPDDDTMVLAASAPAAVQTPPAQASAAKTHAAVQPPVAAPAQTPATSSSHMEQQRGKRKRYLDRGDLSVLEEVQAADVEQQQLTWEQREPLSDRQMLRDAARAREQEVALRREENALRREDIALRREEIALRREENVATAAFNRTFLDTLSQLVHTLAGASSCGASRRCTEAEDTRLNDGATSTSADKGDRRHMPSMAPSAVKRMCPNLPSPHAKSPDVVGVEKPVHMHADLTMKGGGYALGPWQHTDDVQEDDNDVTEVIDRVTLL